MCKRATARARARAPPAARPRPTLGARVGLGSWGSFETAYVQVVDGAAACLGLLSTAAVGPEMVVVACVAPVRVLHHACRCVTASFSLVCQIWL